VWRGRAVLRAEPRTTPISSSSVSLLKPAKGFKDTATASLSTDMAEYRVPLQVLGPRTIVKSGDRPVTSVGQVV
jgi:hypothetical protein